MNISYIIGIALLLVLVAVVAILVSRRSPLPQSPPTGAEVSAESEHAVLIYLPYEADDRGFPARDGEMERGHALQDELIHALHMRGVGELDGDEWGMGECIVFLYGPDADRLFAAIEPVLRRAELRDGAYAIKRYGAADDESVREERVELN